MIRQNRAVPILLVLTLAWILYLGGCFGGEEPVSVDTGPTVVAPTATPARVVTSNGPAALASEDPFVHTIEDGDLLHSIATKYNVTEDVILRANPDLNPNVLIVGRELRIPGASTVNDVEEKLEAAREAGEPIDYAIQAGDSLGAIAQTWTVTLEALLEANPDIDPATLQINQLIVIPPFGTGYTAEELEDFTAPTCADREPGEILEHPVEAGDSLSALAEYYGVTVDEITAANVMDDENQLVVGTVLVIPPSDQSNCS